MSLNHIVEDNYKEWLDPYINSIKIDNSWEYKEADKVNAANLVLDSDLVAQWIPVNSGATPYGNGISVRMSGLISTIAIPATLRYSAPFSSNYSFADLDTFITIKSVGKYLAYVNMAWSLGIDYAGSVKIELAEGVGSFIAIPGGEVRSFPGTTIYSATFPYVQENNVCAIGYLDVLEPNSRVRVVCLGNPFGMSINPSHSSLTIVRVE